MLATQCQNENKENETIASPPISIDGALDSSAEAARSMSVDVALVKQEPPQSDDFRPVPDHIEGRAKTLAKIPPNRPLKINELLGESDQGFNSSIGNSHIFPSRDDLIQCARTPTHTTLSQSNSNHRSQSDGSTLVGDQCQPHARNDGSSAFDTAWTCYDKYWLPNSYNPMYLGYHRESNERTKVLPGDSVRQRPNLFGRYNIPLSQSSATSIARPHAIVQTPSNNNTSKLPKLLHPTIYSNSKDSHHLPSKNNPLPHSTVRVSPSHYRKSTAPTKSVVPVSDSDFVRSCQPILTRDRIMPRNPKDKARASKKRPRTLNQGQLVPASNAGRSPADNPAMAAEHQRQVQTLVAAMNDMSRTEDNEGMVKSWERIRHSKAARLRQVCDDMVVNSKKSHQASMTGRTLCERQRSSNIYETYQDRFDALCNLLTTQKTSCKHLMQEPYINQVVDDPIYAAMRVSNNRRVNKGKKIAIDHGRKVLGLKGNGKGRPLVKREDEETEQQGVEETFSEDGEFEEDDEYEVQEPTAPIEKLDDSSPFPTPTLRDRSTLKKPSYVSPDLDDDLEDSEEEIEKNIKRPKLSKSTELVSYDPTAANTEIRSKGMNIVKPEPEVVGSPLVNAADGDSSTILASLTMPPTQQGFDSFSFAEHDDSVALPNQHFDYSNGYTSFAEAPNDYLAQLDPFPQFRHMHQSNHFGQPGHFSHPGHFTQPDHFPEHDQFAKSVYPIAQPQDQSQFQLLSHLDTAGVGSNETYVDSSSNADNHASDPVTDETDAAANFEDAFWSHNYHTEAPQL